MMCNRLKGNIAVVHRRSVDNCNMDERLERFST